MKRHLSQLHGKLLWVLLIVPILFSCSLASSIYDRKVIEISEWEFNKTNQNFSKLCHKAVQTYGQSLISSNPKDIKDYCPNYNNISKKQKIKFWTALISSLSYFESTHSTEVFYKENFKNALGKNVVSRGLLQISIASSKGYQCNITDENQLHQPQTNLECGVKILNKLIRKDGVIASKKSKLVSKKTWLGAAKYWSPFRDSKKLKIIQANTLRQPYCQ